MGEYIGDRGRSRGTDSGSRSSSGKPHIDDATRTFDLSSAKSASAKNPSSKKAPSSGSRPTGGKSAGGKSTGGKPTSGKSTGSRPASGRPASAKASGSKTSAGRSSSGTKKTSLPSSSQKKSSSGQTAQRNKTASQTKKPQQSGSGKSAPKKNTAPPKQRPAQNKPKSSSDAYFERLEEKRSRSDERELHSSDEARRIKRERRQRSFRRHRKLFNFMFYAAIFIAMMAVIVIMSMTVLFVIEDVDVVTDDGVPYAASEIVSSCDVRKGQNLFTAPIEEAGEQIMTSLPYIEKCTVKRRLPSTVVITAESASPVGIVRDADGAGIVVSSGMRALESVVSAGDAPGVPVINGIIIDSTEVGQPISTTNPAYFESAAMIVGKMNEYGLPLDSISFSSGGNISAEYDNRINIIFGTGVRLDEKIELAATLITEGKITKHETGDLSISIIDSKVRGTFTPDYVKRQHDQDESDEISE